MVLQIPGYYYDEEKKKYFKVDKNGARNHQYSSSSIKHKLERDEVNIKISKLKLSSSAIRLPFIQSETLNVLNKLRFKSPLSFKKSIITYRLSLLEPQEGSPTTLHDQDRVPSQVRSVYFESENWKLICLMRDGHFRAYQVSNNWPSSSSSSSSTSSTIAHDEKLALRNQHHFRSSQSHTLKSLQGSMSISETINLVHTYNDSSNGTSKIIGSRFNARNSEPLANNFKVVNEWLNDATVLPRSSKIITCGDKSVTKRNLNTMEVESSIVSKGDALTFDFIREQESLCYIGYRNGYIKLWDMRASGQSFSMQKSLENFKSFTKLKILDENHIICSSLGSRIDLFDIRIGFREPKVSFTSIKNVQNVHGENIQLIDRENFMVSNKNSTEIFNIYDQRPLKTISTHDAPIETAIISSGYNYDLFTFSKGKYSLFSG